MNTSVTLPLSEETHYFEIRLESIGGLGANLCGKMLGELGALYLNLNSASFASYGSEKRGSPVKAYIRWCSPEKELRINSPVTHPHLLAIFHEALIGSYPVFDGVTEETRIILNTPLSTAEAARKYHLSAGTLFCLDALGIAMEAKSRINMVMLGALIQASGFIPLPQCELLCRNTIGKKYPDQLSNNLNGLHQGYEKLSSGFPLTGCTDENPVPVKNYIWGYRNAPPGGTNTRPGSTVSNDLTASREGYIPLFIPEKCIHCGLCDSTCPDFVFQFLPGTYRGKTMYLNTGLDYYHCKGCLRCVEVCPVNALVKASERDYPDKPYFVPNKDLLSDAVNYEKSSPNSWITSDSYLTEERIDGGLV